jgi:hypothetical protein
MSRSFKQRQHDIYDNARIETVVELQELIYKLVQKEDNLPESERECGVREYPDFREQEEVFCEILKRKNKTPKLIEWNKKPEVTPT